MMKKIIKPEDFPIEMTEENLNILVEMAMADIISNDWKKITFNILTDEQNILINNKISEIQRKKAKEKINQQSLEEKEMNSINHEKMLKKIEEDFDYFYGNMGRPDTLEEYKERIENHLKNKEKKNNNK